MWSSENKEWTCTRQDLDQKGLYMDWDSLKREPIRTLYETWTLTYESQWFECTWTCLFKSMIRFQTISLSTGSVLLTRWAVGKGDDYKITRRVRTNHSLGLGRLWSRSPGEPFITWNIDPKNDFNLEFLEFFKRTTWDSLHVGTWK